MASVKKPKLHRLFPAAMVGILGPPVQRARRDFCVVTLRGSSPAPAFFLFWMKTWECFTLPLVSRPVGGLFPLPTDVYP